MAHIEKNIPVVFRAIFTLDYYLRVSLVVLWGLLLSLVLTPIAMLSWGRNSLAWFFARALSWGGLSILGIKVEVTGQENLPHTPAVLLNNHQSNFDILTAGRVYPRDTVVIGKKELRRIPLFGTFFAATGNVMIDRTDHNQSIAGLHKAVEALRQRRKSIWVFPEGTRGHGKGLAPFKKGAFHMAIEAGVPIVPMVTSSLEEVLDIANRRIVGGKITIRILPPIVTAGLGNADVEALRQSTEARFRAELARLNQRPPAA